MRTLALLVMVPMVLLAQDAGMVLRTSVGYRTQRATRQLNDEQKKEVDRLEKLAFSANAQKQYGEAIRHMHHGMAVMAGVEWTPATEKAAGLVAKVDRAILPSGAKLRVKLSEMYARSVEEPLTARVTIRAARSENSSGLGEQKLTALPADIEVAIPSSMPPGDYVIETSLAARVDPSSRGFLVKSVPVQVGDYKAHAQALRSAISAYSGQTTPALSTALYRIELYETAERGDASPHGIDFAKEFAMVEAILKSAAEGKDYFAGRKGDFHKAYLSPVDKTLQPYRVFVPEQYDGETPRPLVMALHGMGGTENSMLDGYGGMLKREAARLGFLIAAPKGRDSASMYQGAAEKDVLDVLAEVQRDYKVDENRIYLMGHSMGGYGTWSIAMKYPKIWAGLGPIAGGGAPMFMANIKHIPQYVVHGDADKTVPVNMSRVMVKAGQEAGATNIVYVEVPGGNHVDIAAPHFGPMLDFFARHSKAGPAAAQPAQ